MSTHTHHPRRRYRPGFCLAAAGSALLGLLAGCHNGNSSSSNSSIVPTGPLETTALHRGDTLPGITVAIQSITGASSQDGSFQPGDHVTVKFTIEKDDGSSWRLDDFSTGRILLSGPTFNYQRVLPEQQDLLTRSQLQGDGSFRYTFADPIPATYAEPLNDSATFGPADGELSGTGLQAGSYTVGMYVRWSYTLDGASKRDAGDATMDFLFGGAATPAPRQVVGQDNCNQCHTTLQAHGGMRRSVTLCLMCHTSGAEDNGNGTIDFRVMIHKIHNAAHLPSVLGVATNNNGSRNYGAMPTPYGIVGRNNSFVDFSHVEFPVWPQGLIAMPRDEGYTSLLPTEQLQEDTIRTGASGCAACHGDPDGGGPLAAPAQGAIAYSQPSRRACGACHDDVDWSKPYTANGSTMPAQGNDSSCLLCHGVVGSAIAPQIAHMHPLQDPNFNTGTNVTIDAVAEAGSSSPNGKIDPGENVAVTFRITDDLGAEINASTVSISTVLAGPTTNNNLILSTGIPVAALTGNQPFTVNLPQTIALEYAGTSTMTPGEVFQGSPVPHWNLPGAATTVRVRTATSGGDSVLAAAKTGPGNFVDVADVTGFARNDYLVVDDGVAGQVEYAQVSFVDGNRLWFAGSVLSKDHSPGATVREVTLQTKTVNTDYTLDPSNGAIMEVTEFGAGNDVLVSYTTDFVMPATYPLALNDGATLDETWGKWTGKPIVGGTYAVTLWATRTLPLPLFGESNNYRSTSPGARQDFLVGTATALEPYALISSGQNCAACHKDLVFHGGGRRGFETCIACHGTAGSEDRAQYTAANAPATPGVTINFRTMLHKIHFGAELTNASAYTVVGFGSAAYPNNFSAATYAEVEFPDMPGGVQNCAKCHGDGNAAWAAPLPRKHPTSQGLPTRAWSAVCGACHDSDATTAHIEAQTSASGQESCAVCHAENREWNVPLMHKVY